MRSTAIACVLAVAVLSGATGQVGPAGKADLVSTTLVWDRANHVTDPDLIRFDGRWFLACQESAKPGWPGGTIRVLTSADGKEWEAAAGIESPTPRRGLYAPTFSLAPDGHLMVTSVGFLPYPTEPDPLREFGGMLKTLAWSSKDGRAWGKPTPIGPDDFPIDRVVWHKGVAYGCALGRICGSAQTIQILAGKDGRAFEARSTETFRGMMPYEADMLFAGDTAYCVVSGPSGRVPSARLGTSQAPHAKWDWKELNQRVRYARFLRLPDGRVLATAVLYDQNVRTSLCEFQPATGTFAELLELPTGKQAVRAGLAWHDGHVWVSYPVADGERVRLHLAKVKLK